MYSQQPTPLTVSNMRIHLRKCTYQIVLLVIVGIIAIPTLLKLNDYRLMKQAEHTERDENIRRFEISMAKIVCAPEDFEDTPFIKQVKTNTTVHLPSKGDLQKLSREELSFLYHRYIENLQYFCYKIARIGEIRDGGWDVCEETNFKPTAPCIVYSFGINNDFTFDDSAVDEYGCEVHSFDPSMGIKDFHRREMNYFYNLGIGNNDTLTNSGWEVRRFGTIKQKLGHQRKKISIIKIDIEQMEWEVLEDMLSSGDLDNVDTLMIEFHLDMNWPPTEADRDMYLNGLSVLKGIYDLGFRIFWFHRNTAGSLIFKSKCKQIPRVNCHEVSFVHIKNAKK